MSDLMIFVIAYFVAGLMVSFGGLHKEIIERGRWFAVSYFVCLIPAWPIFVSHAAIKDIIAWKHRSQCVWCGNVIEDMAVEKIQAHFLVCEKHPDNQLILKYKTALESIADPRTLYIMECIEMDGLTGFEAIAKRALINDPK